jgi:hypothetical protein
MVDNELTEGTQSKVLIPRSSISENQRIPNVAIFLRRTTLEFLQILFATRETGSFHYDPDDTLTEIQIADQHHVDLDAIHTRPAIVGTRGPLSWRQLGLGGSSVEGVEIATRKTTFNDLLTGTVALSCLSREGLEAELIAHIVFNSFKFFRPILQKYGFFSIKSLNMGGSQLVAQEGDNDDLHIVPVYIQAHIQDRWVLSDEAERKLRKIIIETMFTP